FERSTLFLGKESVLRELLRLDDACAHSCDLGGQVRSRLSLHHEEQDGRLGRIVIACAKPDRLHFGIGEELRGMLIPHRRGRSQRRRGRRNPLDRDRKSTRLNSSHQIISYAVFCLKKNILHISVALST